jgi:hypothetical protein
VIASKIEEVDKMRFVALVVAVAMLGAGVGLVSVGTAQAHGGDGGGAVELMAATNSCPTPVANAVIGVLNCTEMLDGGTR